MADMTNDWRWEQLAAYLANAAAVTEELQVGLWEPELQDFFAELEALRDKADTLAQTISGVAFRP